MRRLGLLLLPFLAWHAMPPVDAEEDAALERRLREQARHYVESGLVVGMAVGTWREGSAMSFGLGTSRRGTEEVPTESTLFEIGSITKVFTGILLADLVREGRLRLDQRAATLLPPDVSMPRWGKQEVTLLHLATHTAGLPRLPSNIEPADPTDPYADYDAVRLHAWLRAGSLEREPGRRSVYSNLGAGLLGHLLARATETDYETLLRRRVLDPLGMTSTTIDLDDEARGRLATGYTAALEPQGPWAFDALAGAGAIRSNVADLLRFIGAHLRDDSSEDLPSSLALAMAEQDVPSEGSARMGLGWHMHGERRVRWHNGQTAGYHAFLAIDADRDLGVVVLANTAVGEVDELGWALLALLAGEEVKPPRLRVEVALPPATLDAYTGTFRVSPAFALVVTLEGGRLHVQATGQGRLPLFAAGDDVFFLRAVSAELHFVRDEAGTVTGLVLHQGGREVPASRE